jgi:hypothetical protein
MLFIDISPKDLARLLLEAMHTLPDGGFGQFRIQHEHSALSHHRTGESAADRVPPAAL